ncbi:MAG: type VI secretion system protein TssA [Acidobacteriota bacterium]
MPLRDDLLNPIPGDSPSGTNLRYAPIFDKIKEARRQDDDAPQGEWQRERKIADYKQVVKLAGDALASQSKDLQLAAWLTEAFLHQEGFSGLRQGLELLRGLVENFWDTLYPEIEDGDLELRSAPLEWAGTRLDDPTRKAPLTRGGFSYYKFKESRTVGSEEDAAQSEQKREAREQAIADGKVTFEEFEKDSAATPTAQYEGWVAALDGSLESIDTLRALCDEKFGNYAPSFTPLKTALEEVRNVANQILQKRLDQEGRRPEPEEVEDEPEAADDSWSDSGAASAAAPARKKKAVAGLEPQDLDEVTPRLAAVARFLRQQDASGPAPYLLLRGYRWGEMRGYGDSPDPLLLIPPSSEVRQNIKRLSIEANWADVLEAAEAAMAEPCGRAWLDLQRYVVKAAEEWGYYNISKAVVSELRALLVDLPQLPQWTLMDDTPTANAETQVWIRDVVLPAPGNGTAAAAPSFSEPAAEEKVTPGEPAPPDTFTLALDAARGGRAADAIQMLSEDIARQQTGRARFHRKLQLAQICMMTSHEALAQPILEELARSIEAHKLEEWESSDAVAHPLAMLYRCLSKMEGDPGVKQRLYAQISRLDPVQALECAR